MALMYLDIIFYWWSIKPKLFDPDLMFLMKQQAVIVLPVSMEFLLMTVVSHPGILAKVAIAHMILKH